jgi:hypothetical protein
MFPAYTVLRTEGTFTHSTAGQQGAFVRILILFVSLELEAQEYPNAVSKL